MNRTAIATATAIFVLATNAFAEDKVVGYHNPKFKVTIPDNFTPLPCTPPVLFLFQGEYSGRVDSIIEITDLGGLIASGRRSREEIQKLLPADTDFELEYWNLNNEKINVIRVDRQANRLTEVNYMALIPLSPRGIRIRVIGADPNREQYYRQYLKTMVLSIEGKFHRNINVMPPMGMPQRIMQICGGGLSIIAFCILIVYLLLRICLIGRAHKLIAMRSRWLAIAGATLLLGSAIRGMTCFMYGKYTEFVPMVVGMGLSFLVIKAHLRLAKIKAANQALSASQQTMTESSQCEQPADGCH